MSTAVEQPKCRYCGSLPHAGVCPTVKAIEYFPDGSVKRVEFKSAVDYVSVFAPVIYPPVYVPPPPLPNPVPMPYIGSPYVVTCATDQNSGVSLFN